jgi:hypothetical protein
MPLLKISPLAVVPQHNRRRHMILDLSFAVHHFVPTVPAPRQVLPSVAPWQMSSVFVDDFILAGVESMDGSLLNRMARAALHGIHSFFPPPAVSGHTGDKDPVSIKKLERGDAQWSADKEILGYMLDGKARTIHLPKDKATRILNELERVLKNNRILVTR